MSIEALVRDYVFKELGATAALGLEDESLQLSPLEKISPLAIAPIASPFGRRKQDYFPIYDRPVAQQGLIPEYEEQVDSSDDYESVEIEDLPTNLSAILGDFSERGNVDIFGRPTQIGPKVEMGTFGIPQTFDPGYALGQFASLSGFPVSAGYVGQKNKEQLQYAQAMASLGKKGYGVGVVNGQVVGITPESGLIGTVPNASPEDLQKIRDTITGKSGPMKAGVEAFENLKPDTPVTDPMRKFQEEVVKSKGIPDYLKEEILGLSKQGLNVDFGVDSFKDILDYRKTVDPKTFIKEFKEATDLGTGDQRDDEIDEQTFIDTTATPKEEEDYFASIPTGGYFTDDDSDDTSYGGDDSFDSDSDPGGTGGYSGGDFDDAFKYGGRVGMSNGGFASKTATVKGIGLIKPEETFMDTDVVRDRYAFDAESGDFIINGPSSSQMKPQITILINNAIDQLEKEGVDIRVGNPKIKEGDKVPLLTASSETYIPRVVAEKIGYPILDALNDMGKPEVRRLKSKLDDEPTDKSKYRASNGGFLFKDKRKGTMLFNQPTMDITPSSNIDRAYDAFVPGISDVNIPMKPDDEMFFGYKLGSIKNALFEKEMKGYEGKGYIFTGVKPKGKKASSAFGKFQITYSTLQDFKDRSGDYADLSKDEKTYIDNLIQQGKDKVNLDLQYGLRRKGKIIPMASVSKKLKKQLSGLQQGTIPQETHKKYYDKIADLVIRQKLKDHKDKSLKEFLASYGEGDQYAKDVEKILLDKKNLTKN